MYTRETNTLLLTLCAIAPSNWFEVGFMTELHSLCRACKHRHRECLTPPYLFRMGAWVQRRTSSSRQASLYNNTRVLPRFRPRKRVTPYFLLFVYIWWMNTRTTGLAVLVLLSSSSNQNLTRIQPLLCRPWPSFYTERGHHSSLRPRR